MLSYISISCTVLRKLVTHLQNVLKLLPNTYDFGDCASICIVFFISASLIIVSPHLVNYNAFPENIWPLKFINPTVIRFTVTLRASIFSSADTHLYVVTIEARVKSLYKFKKSNL